MEAIVTVIDPVASKRIKFLQDNAQWFEDNSPVMPQHKRREARGIDARVVHVVSEAGESAPSTPIGVNLPNAGWFREAYGSKSITIDNIIYAYDRAADQFKVSAEFYLPKAYANLQKNTELGMAIMVDMHEVLGHGSGQMELGVGDAGTALGANYAVLEESRADLFACYYIMDPHVVEIGLLPDFEAGKALYDIEITNGFFMQLTRVPAGKKTLTEAHMRNRQLNAGWVLERAEKKDATPKGPAIVRVRKDGKTYFDIRDYGRCRELFGELLREIQRIKSQGDRAAGDALVEKYGTHIDPLLHAEALERFAQFHMAPKSGFIQPEIVRDETGEVNVTYPEDFVGQMLHFSRDFGTLPDVN